MDHPHAFHRSRRRPSAGTGRRGSGRGGGGNGGSGWGLLLPMIVAGAWLGSWAAESESAPRAGSFVADGAGAASARGETVRARFALCHRGGGVNCVVDGDTVWVAGTKVRIADIDAPETHPPRCAEEARLGKAATRRLQALLNAGPVTLTAGERDTDRYGRALRIVSRDGRSLGGMLVDEGLARGWEGRRRPWC